MEKPSDQEPPYSVVSVPSNLSRREVLQLGAVMAAGSMPTATATALTPPLSSANSYPVRLKVNGQVHQLDIDPRESVLDVLRERLDLTGTKKGCNQGACGACTVLLDGARVNACLCLAAMQDGASITTIEGIANSEGLHPLQAAFIEHDAFQCGYCTPGQVLSGIGCMAEGHAGSPEEIRFWMSGNICRCGAYPGICAAIAAANERS
ncbi:(2Fe-2S)-binding protein [Roseomonas sp. WA12]